jgi:lipid-binding SYLF domain-containing protein
MAGVFASAPTRRASARFNRSKRQPRAACGPFTRGVTMKIRRQQFYQSILATTAAMLLLSLPGISRSASAEDLEKDALQALQTLYKATPVALTLSKSARAILVFPKVVKAGLVFGGSYGEGVMITGSRVTDYFNTVSASWGWQAGAESYAYVVFLMSDKAVKYVRETQGWEFGVGPSVVLVNEGIARNLTTTTLQDDAYAFVSDQQGLMASLSIEGTKITRIKR